ncbi:4050_t:CDS:2, partial [Gigaspora rosea]
MKKITWIFIIILASIILVESNNQDDEWIMKSNSANSIAAEVFYYRYMPEPTYDYSTPNPTGNPSNLGNPSSGVTIPTRVAAIPTRVAAIPTRVAAIPTR